MKKQSSKNKIRSESEFVVVPLPPGQKNYSGALFPAPERRVAAKRKIQAAVAAALLAAGIGCGGQADNKRESAPEATVGSIQEPLLADDNFGWRASNLARCNAGTSDQCYYPPFGTHPWSVCLDLTGFTSAQLTRLNSAIDLVFDTLQGHGVDVTLTATRFGTCDSDQNIHLVKKNLPYYGNSDLRTYANAVCTASWLYSESPSIPGQHSNCYRARIELDQNELEQRVGTQQGFVNHIVGSMFGVVALGDGLTSASSHSGDWDYSSISPGGFDFDDTVYCRLQTAEYEEPDYLFIQKTDTSCD